MASHARPCHRGHPRRPVSRQDETAHRRGPAWPMIVLATPKGWTGPKSVDGQRIEGTFRSHQVPLSDPRTNSEHLRTARGVAEELSARGTVRRTRSAAAGAARSSRRAAHGAWARILTPTAACCLRDLQLPDFRDYAVAVEAPGAIDAEDTRVLGRFLRDVISRNEGTTELSDLRPRRDGVEPARRGVRAPPAGNGTRNGQPDDRVAGAARAACWRC